MPNQLHDKINTRMSYPSVESILSKNTEENSKQFFKSVAYYFHKDLVMKILLQPLIQEYHLSVSGERNVN